MNDICYAEERYANEQGEVNAGDVWRPKNNGWAFCDHVVLGIGVADSGFVGVRMARPYAYASCVGTTGPTVLTGCEVYSVSLASLFDNFRRVELCYSLGNVEGEVFSGRRV